MTDFKIPESTQIGHVHLKVSDLQKSLEFYRDIIGFEVTMMYGNQAAFLSAGGYHHYIGLNTWHSKGFPPVKEEGVGMYHAAILLPTQKDLAKLVSRLLKLDYPLTGAADHGVSEAIYLNDPDGNGLEFYWDKPKEQWPKDENGNLTMYTKSLNINNLITNNL